MNVLVAGCGSIGRRHVRNLVNEFGIMPRMFSQAQKEPLAEFPEVEIFSNLDTALAGVDAVIVANRTTRHVETALAAMNAGAGVFVEKPVSHDLASTKELLEAARHFDRAVAVGYNLRFHPTLREAKAALDDDLLGRPLSASIWCGQYLPSWRPGTDHRESSSAKKADGGGVLLDLSHELDYACWFFGEPLAVTARLGRSGTLDVETEDTADVIVEFSGGCVANIHLDYLDRAYTRGMRLVGENASLEWAYPDGTLKIYDKQDAEPMVSTPPDDYRTDWMYVDELRDFFRAVEASAYPEVTLEEGLRALLLADMARLSSETGKRVTREEMQWP